MSQRERRPLLAASSLLLILVVALPFGFLLVRGFELGGDLGWQVASSDVTLEALARTVGLGVVMALVCVGLALPLAWLTHASDLPWRRAFRVLLILPLAVPTYVGAFVVILVFAPGGWLPGFDIYGWAGVVIAMLFTYPLALLTIQAALDRLDPRHWEAARSLGCTPWAAFRRVVLPELRPAMAGGGLLVALYAVGDFGAVSLLRFESLSYLIYVRHKSLFDRDEAVFLSLLLIAVAAILGYLFLRLGGRAHRQLSGQRRAWPVIRLGRWRWPAFAFCLAVVGFTLLLPLGVVLAWGVRGIAQGQAGPMPWNETLNTVLLGTVAALVIVALAFVPTLAFRLSRRPGRAGSWVTMVSHLGYALPGIVVALALVSLATSSSGAFSWVNALYQTLPLLIIAYVIRFFPLAVHAIDDAVAGHSPAPYWAARTLGCSPPAAWRRVVIPMSRSAIAVGLLAVFIAVVKELPATLILSPIDFGTLATRIWALTEDAYFGAASSAVLLLLAMALVGLLLRPDVRVRGRR